MKKAHLIYLFLSIILISCNNKSKKEIDTNGFNGYGEYVVEVENGNKTKDTVKFMVQKQLIDSLKIDKIKIKKICDEAIIYGDWQVKYKPTYKYDKNGFILYDKETNEILVSIKGTCENAYGVPDEINNTISFNREGLMIQDKDYLPKISTF
jgi:hypothetical protein